MKHPERVEDYLGHIGKAIERATGHLEPLRDFDAFQTNRQVQDAVVRNIEIIGEVINKINSMALKLINQHSQIPWTEYEQCGTSPFTNIFTNLKVMRTTVILKRTVHHGDTEITEIIPFVQSQHHCREDGHWIFIQLLDSSPCTLCLCGANLGFRVMDDLSRLKQQIDDLLSQQNIPTLAERFGTPPAADAEPEPDRERDHEYEP